MILQSFFTSWMNHLLDCMSGCFRCCSKSTPVIAVDEPSKGLKIQGRTVIKPSISDDFWSTSTCDIDLGAIQSRKNVSSISISVSTPSEFVNHGLLRWNQSRLEWVDHKKSEKIKKAQEPVLSSKTTYESILGTSKHFPRPIPLSEMVEFLENIWEHEGLYD